MTPKYTNPTNRPKSPGRPKSPNSGLSTSIRFPPEIKAWLIWQAAEQETTVTALVVKAVQTMMEEKQEEE